MEGLLDNLGGVEKDDPGLRVDELHDVLLGGHLHLRLHCEPEKQVKSSFLGEGGMFNITLTSVWSFGAHLNIFL